MEWQPERLKVLKQVNSGGQAIVELVSYELDDDGAQDFLQSNWPMTWTGKNQRRGHLLLVSKRIKVVSGSRSELGEDLEDARNAWLRLAREHKLLTRLAGLGVPRVPYPDPYEPPGSDDNPWEHPKRVLMAYISGPTIKDLAEAAILPSEIEHVQLSRALARTLAGVAARGVAHYDVSPGQVIIPLLPSGALDWANPVLVDFALGYHRDVPLIDIDGNEHGTITVGGRGNTPGFEPPEWWNSFRVTRSATDEQMAVMYAGDVYGWAQVCAYAATGEWVFGDRGLVDRAGTKMRLGDPPYTEVMAGQAVDYVATPPTHLGRVPAAMRPAILAGLHPRPEGRSWATIEPLLPPDPDLAHLSAALEAAVDEALEEPTRDLARIRGERDGLRADLERVRGERAAARADVDRLRAERDGLKGDLARVRAERSAAREALGAARADLERVRAERDAARDAESSRTEPTEVAADAEATIARLRRERAEAVAEQGVLAAALRSAQDALAEANRELGLAAKRRARRTAAWEEERQKLRAMRKERDAAIDERDRLRARISTGSGAHDGTGSSTSGDGDGDGTARRSRRVQPGWVAGALVAVVAGLVGATIWASSGEGDGGNDRDGRTGTSSSSTEPRISSLAPTDAVSVSVRTLAAADLPPPASLAEDATSGGWRGARRTTTEAAGPVDGALRDRRAARRGPCVEGERVYRDLVMTSGASATLLQEDDETSVVVTDDAGEEVWRASAAPASCSLLQGAGDVLFVPHAEDAHSMTAFDVHTGDPLWRFRVEGLDEEPYMYVLEVHDGIVVVAFSGFLVAADALSGELRWAVEVDASVCAAAGADAVLWTMRCDGVIEHRAWEDGASEMTAAAVGATGGRLLLAPDGAAIVIGLDGPEDARQTVVAGFAASGEETWRTPLDQRYVSYTVVPGEKLFVASDRILFTLDRATGELEGSGGYSSGSIQQLMSAADDLIVVRENEGTTSVCLVSRSAGYAMEEARCDSSFPGQALIAAVDEAGRWWIPRDDDTAVGI